ncbi:MAG: histidine kinase [Parcubacteria group bacterium]|nr:histidine kinase [Parcubacteria group bacterium]
MFTRARIKLTAFYVVILALIIGVFSVSLFHYTTQHIRDNIEEDAPTKALQQHIADTTIDDLQNTLVFSDLGVVMLAGFLSYVLSGKTLKPIEVAHDAQAQFSANASHELRTPLSVIRMENEIFLKHGDSTAEEARALAQSNLEEIERMTVMVENLLLLARSAKHQAGIEFEKVDVTSLVQKTLHRVEVSAKAKRLGIVFNRTEPTYVLGERHLLEQVFANIIQNAITYTEKGTIEISIQGTNGFLAVAVRDTGIGISEGDLAHVHEAFYKADSSRMVTSNGVGLGLSIAHEIVKMHKGEMRMESELGKGTLVIVTLPSYERSTIGKLQRRSFTS